MENKNEIRNLTTRKIISETLLKLLSKKELIDISITEFCKLANINRGTFYNHYRNLAEVYDELCDDFIEQIKRKLILSDNFNFNIDSLGDVLLYIKKEKVVFSTLLKDGLSSPLVRKILDVFLEIYKEAFSKFSRIDQQTLNDLYNYIVYGSISIIIAWAKDNYHRSCSEIAKVIIDFSYYLTKRYQ